MMQTITCPPDSARSVESQETTYLPSVLKRTSWGAVIAGAVVAISAQMLLTVLGIALGATVTDPSDATNVRGASAVAAVWWLATGTLSLFLGACVVGRFSGMTRSPDVLLHGLTMWGVTALFGFLAVTTGAGALYGSSMNSAYSPASIHTTRTGVFFRQVDDRGDSARPSVAEADSNVSPEEARRAAAKASWWTLGGLLMGIGASLAGCWLCAPNRIVLRSPSDQRAL